MYKVKAYKCIWCGKLFESRERGDKHEKMCEKNPYAFSCKDCKYVEMAERTVALGTFKYVKGCAKGHKPTGEYFLECKDKEVV